MAEEGRPRYIPDVSITQFHKYKYKYTITQIRTQEGGQMAERRGGWDYFANDFCNHVKLYQLHAHCVVLNRKGMLAECKSSPSIYLNWHTLFCLKGLPI